MPLPVAPPSVVPAPVASFFTDIQTTAAAHDTAIGTKAPLASPTFTGLPTGPQWKSTGVPGANTTPLTLSGANTSGAPTTGAHVKGEIAGDDTGKLWYCTVAGTPGTWVRIGGSAAASYARVFRSTTQALATDTEVVISFDSESADTAAYHDTVTNPQRLTAPSTGVYRMLGQVTFASNATGIRAVDLRVNGTAYIANDGKNPLSGLATRVQVDSGPIALTAGDYVEIVAFQASGGSLDASSGSGSTFATIERVGD